MELLYFRVESDSSRVLVGNFQFPPRRESLFNLPVLLATHQAWGFQFPPRRESLFNRFRSPEKTKAFSAPTFTFFRKLIFCSKHPRFAKSR
jgi:hypothetical protein